MTLLFDEIFTSGDFSEWDGSEIDAGNSMTIAEDIVHRGDYSAKAVANVFSDTWIDVAYYKNIAEQSFVYHRFYCYIHSLSGGLNTAALLSSIWGTIGAGVAWLQLYTPSRLLRLVYFHDATITYLDSTEVLPLQRWFSLEHYILISGSVGEVRVWLNGEAVSDLTVTGLNNSGRGNVNRVYNGPRSSFYTELICYFDSIKIATEYIGIDGARYITALKQSPHSAL